MGFLDRLHRKRIYVLPSIHASMASRYADGFSAGWVAGHAAGVQAAREAVAEIAPTEFWEGVPDRAAQWWLVKADALAAIDALKEKP